MQSSVFPPCAKASAFAMGPGSGKVDSGDAEMSHTLWTGCSRATASAEAPHYLEEERFETPEGIPDPVIKLDNQSDRYHTVVSIQFGDRLGELLDTVCLVGLWKSNMFCHVRQAQGNCHTGVAF